MKRLRKSERGLTFVRDDEQLIGTRFRYYLDLKKQEIVIVAEENGPNTVSRKKSGENYKALYDLRSKDVRELVAGADYLEIEDNGKEIIVHAVVLRKDENGNEYFEEIGEIRVDKKDGQLPVFTVASLFSGAGLLCNGFKDPQVKFVFATDFNEDCCETYRANIAEDIVCKDIHELTAEEVPDADIFLVSPCCQAFSNANRTNMESETAENKRLLIDEAIRILKAKMPKVFVIENVPGFLTAGKGMYLKKLHDAFDDTYEITVQVLKDDEIGGFSTRKRAIVIASRIGEVAIPNISVLPRRTVAQALSRVDDSWPNQKDVTKPSKKTEELMNYVPCGGNWKDIPESARKFGPSTQSNTYRRLSIFEPSPTITNWRKCILIHPFENRILTVSEAAAIMGLSKEFKILGRSLDAKQQQIGNGVTQLMAKAIKKFVLKKLNVASMSPCIL